jgi:hypothetical protein
MELRGGTKVSILTFLGKSFLRERGIVLVVEIGRASRVGWHTYRRVDLLDARIES